MRLLALLLFGEELKWGRQTGRMQEWANADFKRSRINA
jgi:hypothetical protein